MTLITEGKIVVTIPLGPEHITRKKDGSLDVDAILKDCIFMIKEYGLARPKKLSSGANIHRDIIRNISEK